MFIFTGNVSKKNGLRTRSEDLLCFSALEHFNTTLNMSRKGKEKGDDASELWQLVAEMQAIANFTNKWPIGKSQMCVTM